MTKKTSVENQNRHWGAALAFSLMFGVVGLSALPYALKHNHLNMVVYTAFFLGSSLLCMLYVIFKRPEKSTQPSKRNKPRNRFFLILRNCFLVAFPMMFISMIGLAWVNCYEIKWLKFPLVCLGIFSIVTLAASFLITLGAIFVEEILEMAAKEREAKEQEKQLEVHDDSNQMKAE